MRLGATWNSNPQFKAIFHRFHLGVEVVLVVGFVWFVVSHWKGRIVAMQLDPRRYLAQRQFDLSRCIRRSVGIYFLLFDKWFWQVRYIQECMELY